VPDICLVYSTTGPQIKQMLGDPKQGNTDPDNGCNRMDHLLASYILPKKTSHQQYFKNGRSTIFLKNSIKKNKILKI
jgi:hypothetical protein